MSKTLRNLNFKPALVAFAMFSMCALLMLPARSAHACGPYQVTDEMRVGWVIGSHMAAVKSADQKAFAQVWDTQSGRSTAIDGDRIRAEPILVAFQRWAANPDSGMTWKLNKVDVIDGRLATAKVQMTWHGQKRIEYLTLARTHGQWKLVGKVHMAEKRAPTAKKKSTSSGGKRSASRGSGY